MAMELYYRDMNPDRLRDVPATSVSSNYSKIGFNVGSDAVEAAGSTTEIIAAAHGATAKDFLIFSDGGEESEPTHVASVTADVITLGVALTGTPSSGENFVFLTSDTVDAAEATTTDTIIKATSHTAVAGDLLWFIDGGEAGEPRVVDSVAATTITLNAALSGTPSAAEEFAFKTPTSTDAVEAGTTDTIITATAHAASVNDIFVMTSGGEINEVRVVLSVTDDTFTLNEALSGTPSATETFALITPTGSDSMEAGNSDTRLFATAHSVQVGDEIIMTSGGEDGEAREVTVAATDYFDLESALSGTPSATETFSVSRPGAYTGSAKMLIFKNGLNQAVDISFDGSTDHMYLDASETMVLDLRSNNLQIDRTGFIYVKETTTPTTGSLRLSVIK
jgi:hypothetical protein